MNMQALMKQAQAMQKDINNIKNEIENTVFEGKSSLVSVEVMGNKTVKAIKFSEEAKNLIEEDISMLEDMILIAINDAFAKIDKETEEKMGKYANMMPGLM